MKKKAVVGIAAAIVVVVVAAVAIYAVRRSSSRHKDITGVTSLVKENLVIMNAPSADAFVNGSGKLTVSAGEILHVEYELDEGSFDLAFHAGDVNLDIFQGADLANLSSGGEVFGASDISGTGSLDFGAELGEYSVYFNMHGAVGSATVSTKTGSVPATGTDSDMVAGTDSDTAAGTDSAATVLWTDADNAADAAEAAGVGYFTLPDAGMEIDGGPVGWDGYRYTDLLAEATGFVGAADLTVRKGVNRPDHDVVYDTEDVSGDDSSYACEWEMEAMGWQVHCFGNEDGRTMKAVWHSDNFSYSILVRGQGDIRDTYGLSSDDIAALVGSVE